MSKYISKLFKPDSPRQQKERKSFDLQFGEDKLPFDFAEQILNHDMKLFLSGYSNGESLKALVQLYMKGVEYFECLQDRRDEYFKAKLQQLMNHSTFLKKKDERNKFETPPIKNIQPLQSKLIQTRFNYQFDIQKQTSSVSKDEQTINNLVDLELKQNPNMSISELKPFTASFVDSGTDKNNQYLPTVIDDEIPFQSSSTKESYKQNLQNIIVQNVQEQIYINDEKVNIISGFNKEQQVLNETVNSSYEKQNKQLEERLKLRNRKFSMTRYSSQPAIKKFEFGQKIENQSFVLDKIQEESQGQSRRISPSKITHHFQQKKS